MRTAALYTGVFLGLLLLGVRPATALPIQVTDQVIVEQLLKAKPAPMAARAGWYGPEIHPAKEFNLSYEQYGPAATRWRVRREIAAVMAPPWEWLVVIGLTMVLLRAIVGRMGRGATKAALTGNKPRASDAIEGSTDKAA